jgi:PAS domain S-box-containing protein
MTVSRDRQQTALSPPHGDDEARHVVERMPGIAWSARPDGTPDVVNSRLREFTGRDIDERERGGGAPMWWALVLHPDDVAPWREAWSRAMHGGAPWEIEHRLRRADGPYRWIRTAAHPAFGPDGQVNRWYGVGLDVDDFKRGSDELRAPEVDPCPSDESLTQFLDALPAIVWRATPDGEPNFSNQRATSYSGGTMEDLQSLQWQKDFVHRDDVAMVARAWTRALETQTPFDVASRHRGADGSYRWFHTRAEPLRDGSGRIVHWYGVDVDIDESKRVEDALRETQARLSRASEIATVAELAASIAHEISQPLAALVANAHASLRWMSTDPPNLERAQLTAERIIRDGNAAAEVVSRIRALFKRTDSTRALLNVNEVIAEVGRLIADEASRRNVGIGIDLEDGLPPTMADRVQMQQVIANLARNGIDAMEAIDNSWRVLWIRSRRDGENGLLIEISDQGTGLEDMERAFEPFFTTKENGMGMGLAICRWIVEAHQGRLWATKNVPQGTTFSFTLPAASGDPS